MDIQHDSRSNLCGCLSAHGHVQCLQKFALPSVLHGFSASATGATALPLVLVVAAPLLLLARRAALFAVPPSVFSRFSPAAAALVPLLGALSPSPAAPFGGPPSVAEATPLLAAGHDLRLHQARQLSDALHSSHTLSHGPSLRPPQHLCPLGPVSSWFSLEHMQWLQIICSGRISCCASEFSLLVRLPMLLPSIPPAPPGALGVAPLDEDEETDAAATAAARARRLLPPPRGVACNWPRISSPGTYWPFSIWSCCLAQAGHRSLARRIPASSEKLLMVDGP